MNNPYSKKSCQVLTYCRERAVSDMSGDAHRGTEDSAGAKSFRKDVSIVVPSRVQPQLSDAQQLDLLAAAPLHAPCKQECTQ